MSDRDAIPAEVKRELRREVGYGCPICRSPFLTWHHFDPPYHVKPHNDPKGMIALCHIHHDAADNDGFSIGQLRALKSSKHSAEDVKGNFPSWDQPNFLIHIGGNWGGGTNVVVSVNGTPLIRLTRNEEGMLAVSFTLRAEDGNPLLVMEENSLELYPKNVHDFSATAGQKQVKLWLGERNIGLDLCFERLTLDELSAILEEEGQESKERTTKALEQSLEFWPVDMREGIRRAVLGPKQLPPGAENLPEHLHEAYLSSDQVGDGVKRWAKANCLSDDGKVPVLTFENATFYYHGQTIRVRNHQIQTGRVRVSQNGFFNCGGGVDLPCWCPSCMPRAEGTGETETTGSK